jgi:hypothetical protein
MRFLLVACILFLGWSGLYVLAKELARPRVSTLDRIAALKSQAPGNEAPRPSEAISMIPPAEKAASEASIPTVHGSASWVEVLLPARMHRGPSVETPIIGFQPPGARLRITDNQQGWFEVVDSKTAESGWLYWKYLGSIGDAEKMQMASGNKFVSAESVSVSSGENVTLATRRKIAARSSAASKRYARAASPPPPALSQTKEAKVDRPLRPSHGEMASLIDRAFSGY